MRSQLLSSRDREKGRPLSKQEKRLLTGDAMTNGAVEALEVVEQELMVRGPSRRYNRIVLIVCVCVCVCVCVLVCISLI